MNPVCKFVNYLFGTNSLCPLSGSKRKAEHDDQTPNKQAKTEVNDEDQQPCNLVITAEVEVEDYQTFEQPAVLEEPFRGDALGIVFLPF